MRRPEHSLQLKVITKQLTANGTGVQLNCEVLRQYCATTMLIACKNQGFMPGRPDVSVSHLLLLLPAHI